MCYNKYTKKNGGFYVKYDEKYQDLFSVSSDYYLVHCISGDYSLGAGVAKIIDQNYDMALKLFMDYPLPPDDVSAYIGQALLVENVFNLVTKGHWREKPTYDNLKNALLDMKQQCLDEGITKLVMPKIGCGRDKLSWVMVSDMIAEVFDDTDVEILVCKQ